MPYRMVRLAIDHSVRKLCVTPYGLSLGCNRPDHPNGCPNFNKRQDCPPKAPLIGDLLDLSKPVFAVWNVFDLAGHRRKMLGKHSDWSERQLVNCLYWQGSARKALRHEVQDCLGWISQSREGYIPVMTPEACGVNVTAMMGW